MPRFSELTANFTPEQKARVEATKFDLLRELREERERTQVEMAETMGTTQSAISRIERQENLLLSTLSTYVAATGGRLRVFAEYDDGLYEIEATYE